MLLQCCRPMAALFPVRLDEYCKTFNICFLDLRLRCVFCSHYIDIRELADFYQKQLSLIWRNFQCFACCEQCIFLSARYERDNYFQCTVKPEDLALLVEKPLSEVIIRCYICLDLLDAAEKQDHLARSKRFILIRGHWRGYCRRCMQKE